MQNEGIGVPWHGTNRAGEHNLTCCKKEGYLRLSLACDMHEKYA
jgi:hypothetical protein